MVKTSEANADSLVVRVVSDVDTRSLTSVVGETRRLAASVRDGTTTAAELEGGTFTVSILGMFGMTAIVPKPQFSASELPAKYRRSGMASSFLSRS